MRVWVELYRSGEEREEREGEDLSLHHVGAEDSWIHYTVYQYVVSMRIDPRASILRDRPTCQLPVRHTCTQPGMMTNPTRICVYVTHTNGTKLRTEEVQTTTGNLFPKSIRDSCVVKHIFLKDSF